MLKKIAEVLNVFHDKLTGESASALIEDKLEEKGMTLEEVASRTSASLHWLQNLDTFTPGEWGGKNDTAYKWITEVAEVLGLPGSLLRLALARQEIPANDGPVSTPEEDFNDGFTIKENAAEGILTRVPLLGQIAAGEPILATEEFKTYVEIDSTIKVDFCLRVKGDSMIDARINDGDIVFVRKQPEVENGEIAVVLIDNEATLKRFYKNNGGVILKPENSKYPPKHYTEKDFRDIRILGKAILFQSEVR